MQVTAMDTADDENTYNAAMAHTVSQHITLTISQRTGTIAVLTPGLDQQGGRQEGPLGGVVHVHLPQLAGTDTGQSEQTLTWNRHRPIRADSYLDRAPTSRKGHPLQTGSCWCPQAGVGP